jgi:hypothetical protein
LQNCKRGLALRRVANKSRKERDLMMVPEHGAGSGGRDEGRKNKEQEKE